MYEFGGNAGYSVTGVKRIQVSHSSSLTNKDHCDKQVYKSLHLDPPPSSSARFIFK